ncbi:adenine-specific methyltransferase EcoRI family protein [Campylobacter helveticus]|nr:adenine-specific methyltransferase EcoRI family protein [Campylobacter helveticus]
MLKEADIVVTNPPFSLLREYIKQLFDYEKKFLIVANINLATCKDIFPLIKENKMWLGYKNGSQEFIVPQSYQKNNAYIVGGEKLAKFGNICWLSNLDIKKRHEPLILSKTYNQKDYPKYDNYNAIEINKVANIPIDYKGLMGVPISFLYKYNPLQFKIIGADFELAQEIKLNNLVKKNPQRFYLNGKRLYARIIIQRVFNDKF